MFVDEAVVHIKAGNGGNGCSSFRREKFVPDGGPDGGNGGNGGSIVIIGDNSYNTLAKFKYQKHFIAKSGKSGSGRNKTGESGEDIVLYVPLGTQIIDYDTDNIIYDIQNHEGKIILARGGRGGRGNATFKSSRNQAPRQTTPGEEGEGGIFILRLKLFCDVGIIGLPNAGKSSLINSITNTKSIVGDYPFTTIKPVLGMLEVHYKQYVISDIPGLINGAWQNHGLGHRFLRHIERCKAIIHLIDITSDDVKRDYDTIRHELKMYDKILAKKKELIVFSKIDLLEKDELNKKIKEMKAIFKTKKFLTVSSAARVNLDELSGNIAKLVDIL